MKVIINIFIGIILTLTLTGCIGEDYDVGVPTAHLNFNTSSVQLKEANISWNTASEDVQETVEDYEKYVSSLDRITVLSGQNVSLEFKENRNNGGDIWTDPDITVTLLKDGKETILALDDSLDFIFPRDKGKYVLEVEFINSAGSAQYLGNVVIE